MNLTNLEAVFRVIYVIRVENLDRLNLVSKTITIIILNGNRNLYNYRMSEYIEIEAELSDDGVQLYFYTNLQLSESQETYTSKNEMEEGSPVAQALAVVEGIVALEINSQEIVVTLDPEISWHAVVEDTNASLKDFFL